MRRYWTEQPASVWMQIREAGVARVVRRRMVHVPEAYRWLAARLRDTIPGYSGRLPWWLYCDKPDLRHFRWTVPWGAKRVQIEIEVARDRVFEMPCWAWNEVYCGQFLALSAAEWAAWKRRTKDLDEDERLPASLEREVTRSHERLFAGRVPARAWRGFAKVRGVAPFTGREAVIEEIRLSDVREAKVYAGASRYPPRIQAWKEYGLM